MGHIANEELTVRLSHNSSGFNITLLILPQGVVLIPSGEEYLFVLKLFDLSESSAVEFEIQA